MIPFPDVSQRLLCPKRAPQTSVKLSSAMKLRCLCSSIHSSLFFAIQSTLCPFVSLTFSSLLLCVNLGSKQNRCCGLLKARKTFHFHSAALWFIFNGMCSLHYTFTLRLKNIRQWIGISFFIFGKYVKLLSCTNWSALLRLETGRNT